MDSMLYVVFPNNILCISWWLEVDVGSEGQTETRKGPPISQIRNHAHKWISSISVCGTYTGELILTSVSGGPLQKRGLRGEGG